MYKENLRAVYDVSLSRFHPECVDADVVRAQYSGISGRNDESLRMDGIRDLGLGLMDS